VTSATITCQSCPYHGEGTAIRPFDLREMSAKLNETQPLQQVGKHCPVHGHVEKHTTDKRAPRPPAHVEPYDQHDADAEPDPGNERNVRCPVPLMSKRERTRKVPGPRQRERSACHKRR